MKGKTWIAAVVWFCFLLGMGKMTAKAEPALLLSEAAVVYADMGEEGGAVGNLVRGSSFELLGSVTAEDGSTWYHVSALGTEGYIRGDAEIERGGAQTAAPPAENAGGNGVEGVSAEEAEDNPEEEAEGAEETESAGDISGGEFFVYQGDNTREKTYAVTLGNIKSINTEEAANYSEILRGEEEKSNGKKINKTLVCFFFVLAGSGLTALASYRKMKGELHRGEKVKRNQSENKKFARGRRAAHRKRRHRKKKGNIKKNGRTKKS